jgi:hypothetical protein
MENEVMKIENPRVIDNEGLAFLLADLGGAEHSLPDVGKFTFVCQSSWFPVC